MKKLFCTISIIATASFAHSQVFQEWANRFNGPNLSIFNPIGAVDVNGDVYITGTTQISLDNHLVTIKYNKAGVQQWAVVSNAEQGTAIVLDNACNVYVTGSTIVNGTFDFVTIKYNSSGTEQWQSIYNGALNGFDAGAAIALDNSGNVYVTGTSEGGKFPTTIKYNISGVQQWAAVYTVLNGSGGANAIALDANSNVYITGSTNNDYTTIKYNTNGAEQWVRLYNGTGNSFDEALDIALDKTGNIYITGQSTGAGTGLDYATIKYSNSGALQWVQRYNGPLNDADAAVAIGIDGKNNITVTGKSGTSSNHDFTTIQYKKDGTLRWAQLFNGPANADDFATALAIDNKDNVYITGASTGNGSNFDYATIKYSRKGKLQWTQRFNGSANGVDRPNAIAIDSAANVYITGLSEGSGTIDIATVKYGQKKNLIDLSNPNNPYDSIGILHNNGLDFEAANLSLILDTSFSFPIIIQVGLVDSTIICVTKKEKIFGMSVKYIQTINPSFKPTIEMMKAAIEPIPSVSTILDSLLSQSVISQKAKDVFQQYLNTVKHLSNAIAMNNVSINFENKVVKNKDLSFDEKRFILSGIAVTKYSNFYWNKNLNSPNSPWFGWFGPIGNGNGGGPQQVPNWVIADLAGLLLGAELCAPVIFPPAYVGCVLAVAIACSIFGGGVL